MKQTGKQTLLAWLLITVLLIAAAGCGSQTEQESGSVDDPTTRYAVLMGAKNFKKTFKARGDITDTSGSSKESSSTELLVSGVDGEDNVFYYLDVTGEVDLQDMEKEDFIPEFLKQLNKKTSGNYQYSKMVLLDRGVNYYQYKVKIADREEEETLSSDEEAAEVEKKPMLFMFIEKGERTYELIGLDMEADNAAAFSDSFQEILDEIVKIKKVSE